MFLSPTTFCTRVPVGVNATVTGSREVCVKQSLMSMQVISSALSPDQIPASTPRQPPPLSSRPSRPFASVHFAPFDTAAQWFTSFSTQSVWLVPPRGAKFLFCWVDRYLTFYAQSIAKGHIRAKQNVFLPTRQKWQFWFTLWWVRVGKLNWRPILENKISSETTFATILAL